jgi:hypothetical protein
VIDLHFDDDRDIPESTEDVAQRGNTDTAPSKRMVTAGVGPPVSRINPRELDRGAPMDGTGRARGPVERRVVTHHNNPVRGKVDVEFQPVGTRREPAFERGDGVLGSQCAAPAMGKNPRS